MRGEEARGEYVVVVLEPVAVLGEDRLVAVVREIREEAEVLLEDDGGLGF